MPLNKGFGYSSGGQPQQVREMPEATAAYKYSIFERHSNFKLFNKLEQPPNSESLNYDQPPPYLEISEPTKSATMAAQEGDVERAMANADDCCGITPGSYSCAPGPWRIHFPLLRKTRFLVF